MNAKALVETLWHRIEEEVATLYNTAGKVEADVLVNKVARRLAPVSYTHLTLPTKRIV